MLLQLRLIGKAAMTAVGIGSGVYSSLKAYQSYTENDPYNKLLEPLKAESMKWGLAVSCLGREEYHIGNISTHDEGGAINALGLKELIQLPYHRYYSNYEQPNGEYKVHPKYRAGKTDSKGYIDPDPELAKTLILSAINSIKSTKNLIETDNFEPMKEKVLEKLTGIDELLTAEYTVGDDYTELQEGISMVVRLITGIEFDYKLEVHKLEDKQRWRRARYAGGVGVSTLLTTMGLKKLKL